VPCIYNVLVSVPDLLAVIGAGCALLMVVGSLVLLYRGAITLENANPEDAIKVEFQKVLNIQTRYPALGLFVVGIVFLVMTFWFQKSMGAKVTLRGTLDTADPGDAIAVFESHLGESHIDNGNIFEMSVPCDLQEVQVTI
jgi:hypothetical protein